MSRDRALAQLRASTDPWDPAALAAAATAMIPAHQNERTPPEVAIAVGWLHYQRQEYELALLCFAVARDYLPADARAWLAQQPGLDHGDGRLWLLYPHELVQLSDDHRVLEPTIALARAMVATTGEAVDLACLATAQRAMYLSAGDENLLAEATRSAEQAVRVARKDDPDRGTYLHTLAAAHLDRAERTGDTDAFHAAVETVRAAIEHTPPGDPGTTTLVADLGTMLLHRSQRTGSSQDLEDAVQALTAATQTDDPDRWRHLSMLGLALQQRFRRTGVDKDLQDAEAAGRASMELVPDGHPQRYMAPVNLGNTLLYKFKRTDRLDVLTEAADVLRDGLASAASPLHVTPSLCNLGIVLVERSARTDSASDLEEAIEVLRAANARIPAGHPQTIVMLLNLGNALFRRHERTGDEAALEESIELLRQAVDVAPDGHPDRFSLLSTLGSVVQTRYEHTGDLTDLDEAVLLRTNHNKRCPIHPIFVLILNDALILIANDGQHPNELIPPCWRHHPALATELAVQLWLWYTAHMDPHTTPLIAGDYYLRHLPGFRSRLDRLLGASPGECRRDEHPNTWRHDTDQQIAAYSRPQPQPIDSGNHRIELLGDLHFGFPHLVDYDNR